MFMTCTGRENNIQNEYDIYYIFLSYLTKSLEAFNTIHTLYNKQRTYTDIIS
jgi:hypothetical protein